MTSGLDTTELLVVDQTRVDVEDRAHFLALAAKAMRHIVIDCARRRTAAKRGGAWRRVSLEPSVVASEEQLAELVEPDEALNRLERFDDRMHRVVECRYFGGLTVQETALAVNVAPRTVDRAWQKAKAWLYSEIHEA
jgi:RNA polymerase sigma factor (TIGR02999 family)